MQINLKDRFGFSLEKKLLLPGDDFIPKGKFGFELLREQKSGRLKIVEKFGFPNGITNAGKNSILNTMFVGATQVATGSWSVGLIDNSGFTALSANDTMGSHGGWSEFTGYSATTRPAWNPVTSTAQLLTNTTLATFAISVSGTVYGGFICSDSTKGGTAGTLWSTGAFPAAVPVTGGTDSIRITYNCTC